jgi:DNA-binding transcriptional regulator YiaG
MLQRAMTKDQIRTLRRRLLLKQVELARLAGVSQATVSYIESGVRRCEETSTRLTEVLEAERIRQGLPENLVA